MATYRWVRCPKGNPTLFTPKGGGPGQSDLDKANLYGKPNQDAYRWNDYVRVSVSVELDPE